MGCGNSNLSTEQQDKKDTRLEQDAKQEKDKIKLLLLGAGESGKSTIFKQMKLIYGDKYTDAEREQLISTIHNNILQAVKKLTEQVISLNLLSQVEAVEEFELLKDIDEGEHITPVIGDAIKALWCDPGIKAVWQRRSEFHIIESVQYYFNNIDVIKQPNYIPSENDIVHSRVRTSGIVTEKYVIDNTPFEMYDVGGQRNERKKWIHCFEGVDAVIFVAAISEYDQKLFEDSTKNRMVEALDLFEEICNNIFFSESSIMIYLNKRDLFEAKIKVKNIRDIDVFSDYSGRDNNYDDGVQYFVDKFLSKNKSGSARQIYYHVTCATDTENVSRVFNACKEIVLRQNIKKSVLS